MFSCKFAVYLRTPFPRNNSERAAFEMSRFLNSRGFYKVNGFSCYNVFDITIVLIDISVKLNSCMVPHCSVLENKKGMNKKIKVN